MAAYQSTAKLIIDSMVKRLSDHAYFSTSPKITVIAETDKNIVAEITKAESAAAGMYVRIDMAGADNTRPNTPGPYFDEGRFQVACIEYGQWRTGTGSRPSCLEVAEAAAKILHHYQPLDTDGNAITKSVLMVDSIDKISDDSALIYSLSIATPITIPNNAEPSRS